MKNSQLLKALGLLVLAFLWVTFVVGFFFPDPDLTGPLSYGIHHALTEVLQTALVILTPLVAWLTLRLCAGRLRFTVVALPLLGLVLAGLALYPAFVEVFFARKNKTDGSLFHPYLQLQPPAFHPVPRASNIVFLGGSTTRWPSTTGIQWTARVEELLRANRPQCNIRTHNQGMDWYTTLHSLINYETNIRPAKPSLVVLMHGINDLMHNADFGHLSDGAFREDYGHYLGPISRLLKRRGPIAALYEQFTIRWYVPDKHTIEVDTYPGIIPFTRNLRTIAELASHDGTPVVLMTEPYLYKPALSAEEQAVTVMFNFEAQGTQSRWSRMAALKGMEMYSEKTRELAEEKNLPLVDLEKKIPKTLEYFLDDVHFTDKTHEIVADAVAKGLLPILLAQQRS